MTAGELIDLFEEALYALVSNPQRLWLLVILVVVTLVSLLGRMKTTSLAKSLRSLRTDLIYATFYVVGIYSFFLLTPVHRLVESTMRRWTLALELNLLHHVHPLMQLLIAYVVVDGFGYLAHRIAHNNRWLWRVHGIHHSQTFLTPLTNYRFHFIDLIWLTSARAAASFLLGMSGLQISLFLPLALVPPVLELLAHSGLSWSYGPLGRVLVSPKFHAIHHSAERRHVDRNFGFLFSFWDDLFRTSARDEEMPAQFGTDDFVPDGFLRQQFHPFMGPKKLKTGINPSLTTGR